MNASFANRLIWIAGPCMLESAELVKTVSAEVARLAGRFPDIAFVFKGSFDKANRTSNQSPRGPGIEQGLEWLHSVREQTGLPVTTDVHLPHEAEAVARVCDILQIPAFLSRQTDLLEAASRTGRIVNVKKGQFLSPYDMRHAAEKCRSAGAREVWLTERGFSFGYQNLVVDMRGFPIMAGTGCPVLLDATHSVQLPGSGNGQSGGERIHVKTLARAALAAGASGLFTEVHPDPDNALSDPACQLALSDFPAFVAECHQLWKAVRSFDSRLLTE